MGKDVINVKSNGLRNELKEIRKSIDTLTHALHIMIELQTHKRHEKTISNDLPSHDQRYGESSITRSNQLL